MLVERRHDDREHPARAHCPVVAVLLDQPERIRLRRTGDGRAVPAYGEPQSAARALKHAAERTRRPARPRGNVVEPADVDSTEARALVAEFLTRDPDGGWLDARQTARLLDCPGIPRPAHAYVTTEQEAAEAADPSLRRLP